MTWADSEAIDAAVRIVTAVMSEGKFNAEQAVVTAREAVLEVDAAFVALSLGSIVAACLDAIASVDGSDPVVLLRGLAAGIQAEHGQ